MSEDFRGEIRGYEVLKSRMEDQAKNYNDHPLSKKFNKKIVNSREYSFYKIFSAICLLSILVGVGYFLYLVNEDKFKSNIFFEPKIENPVNVQTNNTYNNDYENSFYNNATIVIEEFKVTIITNQTNG